MGKVPRKQVKRDGARIILKGMRKEFSFPKAFGTKDLDTDEKLNSENVARSGLSKPISSV